MSINYVESVAGPIIQGLCSIVTASGVSIKASSLINEWAHKDASAEPYQCGQSRAWKEGKAHTLVLVAPRHPRPRCTRWLIRWSGL